jgi:DNA-directed RNA polymerase specialized sigma24 family protein
MTNELLRLARGGDREAFRALVEPHRREVQVHCYRMLGRSTTPRTPSQDTLLSAWLG